MFNYQRVSSGNPTLNEGLKRKLHYKMKVLIGKSTINGGFNLETWKMDNGELIDGIKAPGEFRFAMFHYRKVSSGNTWIFGKKGCRCKDGGQWKIVEDNVPGCLCCQI